MLGPTNFNIRVVLELQRSNDDHSKSSPTSTSEEGPDTNLKPRLRLGWDSMGQGGLIRYIHFLG